MADAGTAMEWGAAHAAEAAAKAGRPDNHAWRVSRRRAWLWRLLLVLAGVAYAAAFPPLDLGWLGWFAIAPLFWLVAEGCPTPGSAWRAGWLWGYAWALCSFFWLREIEPFVPFLLAGWLALFPACWAALIPVLRRGVVLPVAVQEAGMDAVAAHRPSPLRETVMIVLLAAWWVVLDWARGWLLSGLPWNYPAATQWRNLPVLQLAEFMGAHGVTFLLVFINLALALAVRDGLLAWRVGRYRRPLPLLVALALLMGTVALGGRALLGGRFHQGDVYFTAGIVQADIPQCRAASEAETANALAENLRLSRELIAAHEAVGERLLAEVMLAGSGKEVAIPPEQIARMGPLGVLIWPETAVPVPYVPGYFEERYPLMREYAREMFTLATETKVRLLIGSQQYDLPPGGGPDDVRAYNSALLLDLDATILERYDKVQIVPFGEYVPFGRHAEVLKRAFGMGRDLSPGTRFNPLTLREGIRAGVNICYEDVFPKVSRNLVLNGANLLVVLTNDAWYPHSSEPTQHLANAVLRTIETRRPMVRCGNNTASCLILPSGAIVDAVHFRPGPDDKPTPDPTRKGPGTAVFVVPIHSDPPLTFHSRHGDVFVLFCGIAVLFGGLTCLWAWRERRETLAAAFRDPVPSRETPPAA
jgi:apolipoprotein N-acyltransferase